MSADQKKIVIIGAGFAGAACAWWLARLGVRNIVVLEREEVPGLHASGLNAGMARRFEEDKDIAPLANEGIDFILNPPAGFCDGKLIECNGSLLLNLKQETGSKKHENHVSCLLPHASVIQKTPLLADAKFNTALWTPTDGVIDINAYLWAFINGAKKGGARFITKCEILGFKICSCPTCRADIHRAEIYRTKRVGPDKSLDNARDKSGNYINKLVSSQGGFDADIVINATGAWAPVIGEMAGAEDMKIKSYRRHLYCTPPMPEVDPKWPFVWDVKNQYYFRPESGGLLLGACDEEDVIPGVPQVNPKIKEVLAEKLSKYCPALAGVSIAREWCGLRTFAPNKRPVIRWDKKIKNFFWLAALGGRGVTCAASAGRMAAEKILQIQISKSKCPTKPK